MFRLSGAAGTKLAADGARERGHSISRTTGRCSSCSILDGDLIVPLFALANGGDHDQRKEASWPRVKLTGTDRDHARLTYGESRPARRAAWCRHGQPAGRISPRSAGPR